MNVLVFDIETIPDLDAGRRLYKLHDLDDAGVASAMFKLRLQQTGGSSDFLKHHLHQVVAISAVLRKGDSITVWSLGEIESDEAEIIQRFFDGLERFTPTLVSWNGSGFDLPVLHYRAMKNRVTAQRYWESGQDDKGFKWNNYLSRFHERHTDLMDVLAGYQMRATVTLNEMAKLLGFPGKLDMDGGAVWDNYQAGDLAGIRNYCETDVLNTWLVYLRYQLMRGHLNPHSYDQECEKLRDYLSAENKLHFNQFLQAWDA